MEKTFDIVKLVEKSPITRLSGDYRNKFLHKIKETFTETQQHLFVTNFYGFLNYHSKNDFVVDLDNIWKWLGFSRKDPAKRLLDKYFIKDNDYRIEYIDRPASSLGGAGLNKETILLSIKTFKKFCMKAGTKKADEIHDYYIKLEELLQEVVDEENNELRKQLAQKERSEKNELREKMTNMQKIKERLENMENRIKYKEEPAGAVVYIGQNPFDKETFKVGITSNINDRVATLSAGTSKYFVIKKTWYTRYNKQIEDDVKQKFLSQRVIKSKEFYRIDHYDEIVAFIEKMVKLYHKDDPQEKPVESKKQVKNLNEKECTKCNVVKPRTDFLPAKEHVDGRQNRCRECVKILQTAYIQQKRQTEDVPQEKQCSQCKLVKTLDHYYVDNNLFDRRGTKCKECIKLVQQREKEVKNLTEYCCCKCKITKPIDQFHKLRQSLTGHQYSCKDCALINAKEMYRKHREQTLNGELDDDEKEKRRIEGRKKTARETALRKKETVFVCKCGTVTNQLNKQNHEKTKNHKNKMIELEKLEASTEDASYGYLYIMFS
jgi:hypothetical protein